jgi:hypothetical protein
MSTTGDTIRLVIASGLLGVAALWMLSTVVFRVSGTWERELSPSEREAGAAAERITLGQLGPLVTGRRDVPGGYQELSGILIGSSVWLTRRDHGVRALTAMGFPEPVAKKLDGEVMAKMELRLRGGVLLEGTFMPQKVEFTHQPPRITRSYFLASQPRRYRRLDAVAIAVEEPAAS